MRVLGRNLKISQLIKKAKHIKHIGKEQKFNELLKVSDIGLLSQSGIRQFIEEYVDFKVIKESKNSLCMCL